MGGTVGLFVGASILSFVEIIYFFTLRLYGTMRMKKRSLRVAQAGGLKNFGNR